MASRCFYFFFASSADDLALSAASLALSAALPAWSAALLAASLDIEDMAPPEVPAEAAALEAWLAAWLAWSAELWACCAACVVAWFCADSAACWALSA